MPELPEVETIVRSLGPKINGKHVKRIWANTPRLFRGMASYDTVKKYVEGKTVRTCRRIGKKIFIGFGAEKDLVIHLMMTGRLSYGVRDREEKFIRFRIYFSDGAILSFSDIRKFGKIDLEILSENSNRDALGISSSEFLKVLAGKKQKIKAFLLDQKHISGIGNIYADEILWEAGINPLRSVNTLSKTETNRLYRAISFVLKSAIKLGGTTFRDYRTLEGAKGSYYDSRKAYQREGEPCARDGALIKRTRVASRSTHFCSKHQK